MNDNNTYECHGYVNINVPSKSSMILIANDGSFKMSFDDDEEIPVMEAPAEEVPEVVDNSTEELKPQDITLGKYRHFKGNEYEVIGFAKDSETTEIMVVYRALYGEKELWVRPYQMFAEIIERDGKKMYRFEKID